jgi:OmpA-OmpF porin, OOP family
MHRLKNLAVMGIAFCGLSALLVACSSWSFQPPMRGNASFGPSNLAALREAAPASPSSFTQALTKEYAALAGSLHDEFKDWADTDYFARKGLFAAHDRVTPPEDNSNWLVPLEVPDRYRSQLAEGRTRLLAALDNGGRERMPLVAARAQVNYDCWVERMEDDWKSAITGPCRQRFYDALAEMQGRPAPAAKSTPTPGPGREYRVYFDFNKTDITPEAKQILDQVIAQAKADPKLKLVLVGKADTTGTDAYNLKLSESRSKAVSSALAKGGVAEARIESRWVGDRQPPVPTGKNVKEPRNRVVEISIN